MSDKMTLVEPTCYIYHFVEQFAAYRLVPKKLRFHQNMTILESIVKSKSLGEINFWFFFYDAKYLIQIRILILIANEMLYLTHHMLEFHKGVIGGRKGKVYKNPKTQFFNFLNTLWELVFDDTIWKSVKFWAKWVVAAFCTTFP